MVKSITKLAQDKILLQDKRRKAVDWAAVEKDYSKNDMTLRELGAKYSIGHNTISRRAAKYGWVKDIKDEVKKRADHLVSQKIRDISGLEKAEQEAEQADQQRTNLEHKSVMKRVEHAVSVDRDTVDANAEHIAAIDWRHRSRLSKLGELAEKLTQEVEIYTDHAELLTLIANQAGENGELTANQERNIAQMLSFNGRIDSFKKLTEATKTVTELERKIVGLDTGNPEGDESKSIVIDFGDPVE